MFERKGHHIVHTAKEWELRPEARRIRQTPTLIVPIERSLHEEIHHNCPAVPLLGYHALLAVNSSFEEGNTALESMDNLMLAIEKAGNHPKAHLIEKKLAELAVWAIDLQRPFITEATDRQRYNILMHS